MNNEDINQLRANEEAARIAHARVTAENVRLKDALEGTRTLLAGRHEENTTLREALEVAVETFRWLAGESGHFPDRKSLDTHGVYAWREEMRDRTHANPTLAALLAKKGTDDGK